MIALVGLVGLVLGAVGVWWLQRAELQRLRADKATAEDRLFYAWRDQKVVPAPRPTEAVAVQTLPKILQDEVSQWEDPETRAAVEAKIRGLLEQGLGEAAVLKALDQPKY